MTRIEKAERAKVLSEEGLVAREIAERMGVARSTVSAWLEDPDGSKLAARKRSYGRDCELCGKRTDGGNGPAAAPAVCAECLFWTEGQVIDAMQRWAAEHGGIPPSALDWRGTPDGYPSFRVSTIRRVGWNQLLLKAGFGLKCDRRPETQAKMEAMIREGKSNVEIADHFGWTSPSNVYVRLQTRGLTRADLEAA